MIINKHMPVKYLSFFEPFEKTHNKVKNIIRFQKYQDNLNKKLIGKKHEQLREKAAKLDRKDNEISEKSDERARKLKAIIPIGIFEMMY